VPYSVADGSRQVDLRGDESALAGPPPGRIWLRGVRSGLLTATGAVTSCDARSIELSNVQIADGGECVLERSYGRQPGRFEGGRFYALAGSRHPMQPGDRCGTDHPRWNLQCLLLSSPSMWQPLRARTVQGRRRNCTGSRTPPFV
jgi:hypothetical protein